MHCKNLLQNQLKDCIAEKHFAETVLLTYVGCVTPAALLFPLESVHRCSCLFQDLNVNTGLAEQQVACTVKTKSRYRFNPNYGF
jgi:hypothetical protein